MKRAQFLIATPYLVLVGRYLPSVDAIHGRPRELTARSHHAGTAEHGPTRKRARQKTGTISVRPRCPPVALRRNTFATACASPAWPPVRLAGSGDGLMGSGREQSTVRRH